MPWKKIAASAAFFIFIFGLLMSTPIKYTEVNIAGKQCKISSADFDLQWKHSVEKTIWTENYQRQQQHFLLRYTDLISFGAGTPANLPIISQKNGVIRMSVNQKIEDIDWIVSRNMQGTLKVNKNEWSIYKDYPDYTLVNIAIQQQPLWKTWTIGECL